MTSRAGPTILERILDGREPLLDLMSEYRAAIEQEVRDDIRARVEALRKDADEGYAMKSDNDDPVAYDAGRIGALDAVLAAISSSSATHEHGYETTYRGSERVDVRCRCGKTPMDVLGEQTIRSSATETQDGERPAMGLRARGVPLVERSDGRANIDRETRMRIGPEDATPTPDDRDREHESHDLGPDCPDPIEHVGPQSDDQVAAAVRTVRTALDDRDRYCIHGERDTSDCPDCGLGFITEPPDDRDREVERIAAVLHATGTCTYSTEQLADRPGFRTKDNHSENAAALYDAGLRASGGD